jgi:hypothetical protein
MDLSTTTLDHLLRRLGTPQYEYSIGADKDNTLCLVRDADRWLVYFSERGSHWDEVAFESESTACAYYLGLVARDYIERTFPPVQE